MNSNLNLTSKRIMLTGGAGFLGSFVTEKLKARKAPAIEAAFKAAKPEIVIHLAAKAGGIGATPYATI